MFKLFGNNAFAARRRPKVMPIDCANRIESLEERLVLATNVNVVYNSVTGDLTINGTGADDDVTVNFNAATNSVFLNSFTATSQFVVNGAAPVAVTGNFLVTGNLTVSLGNGNDTFELAGGAAGKLDSGNISIDLGSSGTGPGDVILTSGSLTVTGDVFVTGGTGYDFVRFGDVAQPFTVGNLYIDNGTDDGAADQPVYLDNVTVNGNVTIVNGGTGEQKALIGTFAPNTIAGNLTIIQSNPANTLGYTVDLNDTTVVGNVSITNGSGTNSSIVRIGTKLGPATISGTTTIVNGNNADNEIDFEGNLFPLKLAKSIVVKNGNATTTNLINVDGLIDSGSTSASFTNGTAATSNNIRFGVTTANTINGVVAVTNSSATGSNTILVSRGDFNSSATLSNSVAGAANNAVTIGDLGVVTLTGSLVINNANAANSNAVTIDGLTTDGAKAGNVTINNGTALTGAGTTQVLLGGTTANDFGGNLTVRNQASSGLRTTTLNQTRVRGTTGAYIYNVGAGNTAINVGTAVTVTVDVVLKIEDGTGTAAVNLQRLTAGSLNYSDIGGGADVIDLAGNGGAGTVQINGVTRLNTGNGSDTVRIGTTGTAVFNDSVYITLGSGSDNLQVGANAASPAFSSLSKFQFDGGAGDDTIAVNPLSIADYEPVLPGKKLRFKITNFEHLS